MKKVLEMLGKNIEREANRANNEVKTTENPSMKKDYVLIALILTKISQAINTTLLQLNNK